MHDNCKKGVDLSHQLAPPLRIGAAELHPVQVRLESRSLSQKGDKMKLKMLPAILVITAATWASNGTVSAGTLTSQCNPNWRVHGAPGNVTFTLHLDAAPAQACGIRSYATDASGTKTMGPARYTAPSTSIADGGWAPGFCNKDYGYQTYNGSSWATHKMGDC